MPFPSVSRKARRRRAKRARPPEPRDDVCCCGRDGCDGTGPYPTPPGRIVVTVDVPAEHLTDEEYLDRLDPLMDALLDLEARNPRRFQDPGVAAQAGPTSADRRVEVEAIVHFEPDHVWARVPALPGCFATGATPDELRAALAEAVQLWLAPPA
jgi:hypothetical protein